MPPVLAALGVPFPRAKLLRGGHTVELHEDGPIIQMVIAHADQILAAVTAFGTLVQAWAAVRLARQAQLPPGDMSARGGTIVQVGDIRMVSDRTLNPDELTLVPRTVASAQAKLAAAGNVATSQTTSLNIYDDQNNAIEPLTPVDEVKFEPSAEQRINALAQLKARLDDKPSE